MFMRTRNEFADWLDRKFVSWMNEIGHSRDQKDFAKFLGVNYVTLNRHLTGKRMPRQDDPIIEIYAEKLGQEVYDVLGYKRPDPDLDRLIKALDMATPEQREEIIRQAFRVIGFEPEAE